MTDTRPKDVLLFRRVESVYTEPSLLVRLTGGGDEVGEEVELALKETSWNWKTEKRGDLYRYGDHEFSFNVGEMGWTLFIAVVEHPTPEPVKEIYIKITLVMVKPEFRLFYVIFWPDKVRKSEINLRSLLLSVSRSLAYIACDAENFRNLIRFANYCNIWAYHDGRHLTRADVVMRRKNVPYDFVATYHFSLKSEHSYVIPNVSVRYSIVAHGKANFDVLSEAIIDEYWKEFIGGGGER